MRINHEEHKEEEEKLMDEICQELDSNPNRAANITI